MSPATVVAAAEQLLRSLSAEEVQNNPSARYLDDVVTVYREEEAEGVYQSVNIPAACTAYLDWRATGDSSPSNLIWAIIKALHGVKSMNQRGIIGALVDVGAAGREISTPQVTQAPCAFCGVIPDSPFSSRNPPMTVCYLCWASRQKAAP